MDGVPQTTTYAYDTVGNLTEETDATGHATTYAYDVNGNRDAADDDADAARRRDGDAGDALRVRPNNRLPADDRTRTATFTRSVYDALGRQVETYDKLGHRTTYTYDVMGRLMQDDYADATFEQSTYDDEGRRLTLGRPARQGRRRTSTTTVGPADEDDVPGRRRSRENTYDPAGRLTAVRDARGKTTTYEYDDARTADEGDGAADDRRVRRDRVHVRRERQPAHGARSAAADDDVRVRPAEPPDEDDLPGDATLPSTYTETTYDTLGRRKTERDQAGRVTTLRVRRAGPADVGHRRAGQGHDVRATTSWATARPRRTRTAT